MRKLIVLPFLFVLCLPVTVIAQQQAAQTNFAPVAGDRELSLSGSGTSDRNFDSGSFSVVGEMGWYWTDDITVGIRQSINYASIEGETLSNDFWNGSTRAYGNFHFGGANTRPFLGGSLGAIYGDGIRNSGFAGLETGLKHYVQSRTYILGRVEYQWFFNSSDRATDAFRRNSAWVYTLGLGYNF